MLRLLQTAFLWVLFVPFIIAQGIQHPAKWRSSVKDAGNGQYILELDVQIQPDWHLYAPIQKYPEGDGPLAAHFTFSEPGKIGGKPTFLFLQELQSSPSIEKKDEIFGVNVRYYEDHAHFSRTIKRQVAGSFEITAAVSYQVCSSACINETNQFTFSIPADNSARVSHAEPSAEKLVPALSPAASAAPPKSDSNKAIAKIMPPAPAAVANSGPVKAFNFWSVFLAGFLAGFAAIITPCVYSMVPLTVSFFTKQSKTRSIGIRNALLYGLFIVLIYDALTLLITLAFGAQALNGIASNVGVNIFFFLIFVVFAASFLGAFEINLPSSWINKADSASERGGVAGIFFMAFTLVLVSFSCTGPVVGGLLPLISNGTYLAPLIGMTGFGLCLALPFAMFALFPGWLNALPKSGGWLNAVKVVLGLLELALAMKFLSNADLVAGWHLISREIFIAFWAVCFGVMGFYLLGKIKFSHDSETTFISVPRAIIAIIALTFTLYLLPGLWGAPLNLISGFPPPQSEGWSENAGFSQGFGRSSAATSSEVSNIPSNHFKDYDQALAFAKKVHKPLLLDFTGWTCVNCRKMEQNVWTQPEVSDLLDNDFVIASLYVDDRQTGKRYSEMETKLFQHNAQPYYVVLSNNEKVIGPAVGYSSKDEFALFLRQAKQMFQDSTY